jgi:hypothetical protein
MVGQNEMLPFLQAQSPACQIVTHVRRYLAWLNKATTSWFHYPLRKAPRIG